MQRANVNARSDDASSENRQSFAEVLSPSPALGFQLFWNHATGIVILLMAVTYFILHA